MLLNFFTPHAQQIGSKIIGTTYVVIHIIGWAVFFYIIFSNFFNICLRLKLNFTYYIIQTLIIYMLDIA
jgi:hypothetical protein